MKIYINLCKASHCEVGDYFSNVLLGNHAWINENNVCLNWKLAGFWLDWFWPENWLSKHWLNLDYLAACPQQWFQQVSEIFLVEIVLKNCYIILIQPWTSPCSTYCAWRFPVDVRWYFWVLIYAWMVIFTWIIWRKLPVMLL